MNKILINKILIIASFFIVNFIQAMDNRDESPCKKHAVPRITTHSISRKRLQKKVFLTSSTDVKYGPVSPHKSVETSSHKSQIDELMQNIGLSPRGRTQIRQRLTSSGEREEEQAHSPFACIEKDDVEDVLLDRLIKDRYLSIDQLVEGSKQKQHIMYVHAFISRIKKINNQMHEKALSALKNCSAQNPEIEITIKELDDAKQLKNNIISLLLRLLNADDELFQSANKKNLEGNH